MRLPKTATVGNRLLLLQLIFLAVCGGTWLLLQRGPRPEPTVPQGPEQTLSLLRSGNARFVRGHRTQTIDTSHDDALRQQMRAGERPIAAVVCPEGTLVPEVIFDQKMGRLYVVRGSGGRVDEVIVTALDHAVTDLHVRAIVLLAESAEGREEATALLRRSLVVRAASETGKLALVAGVYDPASGFVRFEPVGHVLAQAGP